MQNNNRCYTFLFTRKSRSRIYVRRIQISKKVLNTSVASIIVSLGIVTAGIAGILKADGSIVIAQNQLPAPQTSLSQPVQTTEKSFNYNRPSQLANNTGGPASPFVSTNAGEAKETSTEAQLRSIEASSSPQSLPNIWAHLGKINNEYGYRRSPFGGGSEFHGGMDIDGDKGDIIVAPANGVVTKAGWQGGYGNLIEIDHGNGLTTRYGHLSAIQVNIGDQVNRGQLIGLLGSTGRSTGPHLHFEIRVNDKPINPRRFLPPAPTEIANN